MSLDSELDEPVGAEDLNFWHLNALRATRSLHLRLIPSLFQERPIPYLNSTLLKRDKFSLL
jgi:hypothetical protein